MATLIQDHQFKREDPVLYYPTEWIAVARTKSDLDLPAADKH